MKKIWSFIRRIGVLKVIKISSVILLVLFLIICFPFLKDYLVGFKDNAIMMTLISYKKEKNIIFGLLNIIILISIYELFISDENKKQNINKFLIKRLGVIEKSLDEIYSFLKLNTKLEDKDLKEIRILMKKIEYNLNVLMQQSKLEELERFKNKFDYFNSDFSDYLIDQNLEKHLIFQNKISILENLCLETESKII